MKYDFNMGGFLVILLIFSNVPSWGGRKVFRGESCVDLGSTGENGALEECGEGKSQIFTFQNLKERSLRGANLTATMFLRPKATRTAFDYAILNDSEVRAGQFELDGFFQADLRGLRWVANRCEHCDFSHSDLRAARLNDSRFYNSDFQFAQMNGAFVERSIFRGCDFRGAKMKDVMWIKTKCEKCRANTLTELPWPKAEAERRGFVFE